MCMCRKKVNKVAMYRSNSPAETENLGEKLARIVKGGTVVALYGGMGMGKTVFVRGMAKVLSPHAEVQSPTFALVNEYPGNPPLVHFDMYRVNSWDDLYVSGFWDYLDAGAVVVTEWSENIESALPDNTVRVIFTREGENERTLETEAAL